MRFKTLIRNVNVLNVLLMAAIALCALYILSPLLHPQVAFTLPSPKKPLESKEEKGAENPPVSPMEYTIIAEKNILHPERKIPVDKPEASLLPKPDFVLYGTLIAGDTSLAYLEDQKASTTAQGKGRKPRPLKKGETMSGFTLKEIETEKVVMVRGEETIEVRVSGHSRQEKQPAQVSAPKTSATPAERLARPRGRRERQATPSN